MINIIAAIMFYGICAFFFWMCAWWLYDTYKHKKSWKNFFFQLSVAVILLGLPVLFGVLFGDGE